MRWLVEGVQRGDSLVFYFSGHGSNVPDFCNDEVDGFNETLCPVDYRTAGMIIDDEINATIVRPLPKGAYLHAIVDACHSGTILDLQHVYRPSQDSSRYVRTCDTWMFSIEKNSILFWFMNFKYFDPTYIYNIYRYICTYMIMSIDHVHEWVKLNMMRSTIYNIHSCVDQLGKEETGNGNIKNVGQVYIKAPAVGWLSPSVPVVIRRPLWTRLWVYIYIYIVATYRCVLES